MSICADRLALALHRGAIVLTALALPLLVFGRGAMQAALGVAVVLALAAAWRGRWPVLDVSRCRPLVVVVGAVALAWLPSVALSLDPLVSLGGWARTLALTVGGMILWTALARDDADRALAFKVLLGATAVATVAALVPTLMLDISHPVARSMKSKASAFVVMLPLLVYAARMLGRRWWMVAALAALAALGLVLTTGSKSGLAGLAVACVVVVGLYAVRRRRPWIIILGVVAALALVAQLKPWQRPAVDAEAEQYRLYLPHALVDTHRQVIWRFTFEKFLEKPVFGWGVNVINRSPGAGDLVPGMLQEFIPSHPHSWLVEVSSETGAVGFTALVAALGWAVLRLGRSYLRGAGAAALAGVATLTIFWSSAAFNFSVWAVWWQLVLITVLGLIFSRRTG